MPELWPHAVASPRGVMKVAADLEEKGWDGRCVAMLQKLAALGLGKLFFGVMFRLVQTPEGRAAKALMEREILPALRRAA